MYSCAELVALVGPSLMTLHGLSLSRCLRLVAPKPPRVAKSPTCDEGQAWKLGRSRPPKSPTSHQQSSARVGGRVVSGHDPTGQTLERGARPIGTGPFRLGRVGRRFRGSLGGHGTLASIHEQPGLTRQQVAGGCWRTTDSSECSEDGRSSTRCRRSQGVATNLPMRMHPPRQPWRRRDLHRDGLLLSPVLLTIRVGSPGCASTCVPP